MSVNAMYNKPGMRSVKSPGEIACNFCGETFYPREKEGKVFCGHCQEKISKKNLRSEGYRRKEK